MRGARDILATAATLLLGSVGTTAFAQAGPSAKEREGLDRPASKQRWYGWQTLTVDAVPAALFSSALPANEGQEVVLWGLGSVSFALGGPIVHAAHGRPLTAFGSLALRLGLPVLGMSIGSQFLSCEFSQDDDDFDPSCEADDTPLIVGGLFGAATASALDAGFLAFEPNGARPRRERGAFIAPSLSLPPGGAQLMLRGAF